MGRSPSLLRRHSRPLLRGRSPGPSKDRSSPSFPLSYPHSSRIHLVQNSDGPAEHITFSRAQFCYPRSQPCIPAPSIRQQHVAPGRGQSDHTLPPILRIWPPDDKPTLLEPVDDPRHGGRLNLLRRGELPHQLVARVQQYGHRRKLIRVEVKRLVAQLTKPTGQPEHRWSECAGQTGNRPQISACQVGADATQVRNSHLSRICLATLISKAKDLVRVLVPQPRGTRQPAEAPEEKVSGARKGAAQCAAVRGVVSSGWAALADELGDDALNEVQDECAGHNIEQRVHLTSLTTNHLQHHMDDEARTDTDRDREGKGHQGHGEEGW